MEASHSHVSALAMVRSKSLARRRHLPNHAKVRSMTHPLYGRPFVNRNPEQTNMAFAPGYESRSWAMPLA